MLQKIFFKKTCDFFFHINLPALKEKGVNNKKWTFGAAKPRVREDRTH